MHNECTKTSKQSQNAFISIQNTCWSTVQASPYGYLFSSGFRMTHCCPPTAQQRLTTLFQLILSCLPCHTNLSEGWWCRATHVADMQLFQVRGKINSCDTVPVKRPYSVPCLQEKLLNLSQKQKGERGYNYTACWSRLIHFTFNHSLMGSDLSSQSF